MIPNVIKVFYLSITEACQWRTHRQGVTQACVVSNWNLEEFEDIKGGNQNPYIEEDQTTQWPKEKVQNDKQRSTKHTHKTKDRVTRTQLKTGGELRCFGRVGSSCFTSGTHRVNLVTNPVISDE